MRERHVGFSTTGQSAQDSTFIHTLQVAQILTQVQLWWVTLWGRRETLSVHWSVTDRQKDDQKEKNWATFSISYSVTSCSDPSVCRRTLTRPSGSSGVPSSGFSWVAEMSTYQPIGEQLTNSATGTRHDLSTIRTPVFNPEWSKWVTTNQTSDGSIYLSESTNTFYFSLIQYIHFVFRQWSYPVWQYVTNKLELQQ